MGEVTAGASEHELVGVGRVVELAFDQIGEVRRVRRDLGHDAGSHLIAEPRLLGMVAADGGVEGEAAGDVLPGRGQAGIAQ